MKRKNKISTKAKDNSQSSQTSDEENMIQESEVRGFVDPISKRREDVEHAIAMRIDNLQHKFDLRRENALREYKMRLKQIDEQENIELEKLKHCFEPKESTYFTLANLFTISRKFIRYLK